MNSFTDKKLQRYLNQDGTILFLVKKTINDEEILEIMRFIENHPHIKKIDFSYSAITDQQVKIFAQQNKTITTVSFCGSQISDRGVKKFAKHNKVATDIDLSENKIRATGAKDFAEHNKIATHVNFKHNKIGSTGAIYFAEHNKITTHVNLSYTHINDADVKCFAKCFAEKNKVATHIDFKYNKLENTGAKDFAVYNKVATHVDLGANKITDTGIKDFAVNNKVATDVSFRLNHISNTGAKDFAVHNIVATHVDFCLNQISNTGIKDFLEHNTVTTHIDLRKNTYSRTGIEDFANALKNNYTLLTAQIEDSYSEYKIKDGDSEYKIKDYLKRNRIISTALNVLKQHYDTGFNADSALLDTQLGELEQISDFKQLPEDSYPKETHRLVSIYRALHSEIELASLIQPFKNQGLQKIADNLFAELFFHGHFQPDVTYDVETDVARDVKAAVIEANKPMWLFALYCWKDKTQGAMDYLVYRQFYNWINQSPITDFYSLIKRKDFMKQTILLNTQDLERLISQSLSHGENPNEIELLKHIACTDLNHPLVTEILIQLPSFSAVFKQNHPNISTFSMPQYALFYENPSDCLRTIKETNIVSKEGFDGYYTPLLQLTAEDSLEAKVTQLKNNIRSLCMLGEEVVFSTDTDSDDKNKTDSNVKQNSTFRFFDALTHNAIDESEEQRQQNQLNY